MSIYRIRTEFGKHLKVILGIILVVFIIGAVWQFSAAPVNPNQERAGSKNVIAIVDKTEITQDEFDRQWDQARNQISDMGVSSTLQLADFRSRIFQNLLQTRLLLSVAKQRNIEIDQSDVDKQIDDAVVANLKANRQRVLGKLTKEQEKLDPRDDSEYKSELAKVGYTLDQMIEMTSQTTPRIAIEAQLAWKAIQDSVKKPTGKDVTKSYNVYNIQQIYLTKGKLPEEQAKSLADKIVAEAKKGTDFAKLAKENSDDPMKNQGGRAQYSFDSQWMFPTEVGKAIEKMKPGEVSDVFNTDRGIYIIKLESVVAKLPAKMDKKTINDRKKQISQMWQMAESAELNKQMMKVPVKVTDDEMRGYWEVSQAQQSMSDPAKSQKHMMNAINAFKEKLKDEPNNDFAGAELGQLYVQQGKDKEAIEVLYPMLKAGSESTAQGADLRIMLADLLVKRGQKDDKAEAIKQYQKASDDASINEGYVHQQLASKFKQLGRPDLAAKETQLFAESEKRMKALEEQRKAAEAAATKPVSKKSSK